MTTTPHDRAAHRRTLRNRYGFGLGTLGRDAAYTMISLYLIFYLSDVLEVSDSVLGGVTVVLVVVRIFDAVNDPFMGVLIDNTRSRFGKFKPWIVLGALTSSVFMVLMFAGIGVGMGDLAFILTFAAIYLAWEITFTANDIGYWSMLPALTQDQVERERIGAFARICANIGTFTMVVAIVPVSNALAGVVGDLATAYLVIAGVVVALTLACQAVMVVLVAEDPQIPAREQRTPWHDLAPTIFRNDQLIAITVALVLFMTAFTTTVSFGIYYFKYVWDDEGMYAVFAAVLGVAQIGALVVHPWLSVRFGRESLFRAAIGLVAGGYVLFFLTPIGQLALIVVAGLAIFAGQATIQLLMLMFIADTVEYGQWKLGRRNESITLSLQPFIYKLGSAAAAGIVGWTVIASGMSGADSHEDMTDAGITLVKTAMLLIPLALIVLSYIVHRRFYRLDATRYAAIVAQVRERDGAPTPSDEVQA